MRACFDRCSHPMLPVWVRQSGVLLAQPFSHVKKQVCGHPKRWPCSAAGGISASGSMGKGGIRRLVGAAVVPLSAIGAGLACAEGFALGRSRCGREGATGAPFPTHKARAEIWLVASACGQAGQWASQSVTVGALSSFVLAQRLDIFGPFARGRSSCKYLAGRVAPSRVALAVSLCVGAGHSGHPVASLCARSGVADCLAAKPAGFIARGVTCSMCPVPLASLIRVGFQHSSSDFVRALVARFAVLVLVRLPACVACYVGLRWAWLRNS